MRSTVAESSTLEQVVLILLLVVGMYFPTSVNGEHNPAGILITFAVWLVLLVSLVCKRSVNLAVAGFISIPIMMLLSAFTLWGLLRHPVKIDSGLFVKFGAIALLYTVDLRGLWLGRIADRAFVLVNVLNIAMGILILAGNDWVTDFLPRYYWNSDSLLVPHMLALHKPILTFGTHSLAGLFLYLFFWVTWEAFRCNGSRLAMAFALTYFILLLALASFTSLALAALAAAEAGSWLWKRNRHIFCALVLGSALAVVFFLPMIAVQIDDMGALPQFAAGTFLNLEQSGLLSRYGPGGDLKGEMNYLSENPFSPIGLASPEFDETPQHFGVGDSGPLEYLVRGSIPLLLLLYYGLYRFLKHNLVVPAHVTKLFLVLIFFETGFSALTASRAYFLLPFFIVCLNQGCLNPGLLSSGAPLYPARR